VKDLPFASQANGVESVKKGAFCSIAICISPGADASLCSA
jgi:hypothetical protein